MQPLDRRWVRLSLPVLLAFVHAVVIGAEPDSAGLELRIVSIDRGNRESSFGDDPRRFATTAVFKAAQKSGIDPGRPDHPLVVFKYDAGRLFYLFYNNVVNVPGGRYLIQRVKRTTIDYAADGKSTTDVAYLVEAIKTIDGRSKRPDQHFGSYSLRDVERREIVKEFDIGIGEVTGIAEGDDWPFHPGDLYHRIQAYSGQPDKFEQVQFDDCIHWTLRASFDRHGNYELRCPELGIELLRNLPAASE